MSNINTIRTLVREHSGMPCLRAIKVGLNFYVGFAMDGVPFRLYFKRSRVHNTLVLNTNGRTIFSKDVAKNAAGLMDKVQLSIVIKECITEATEYVAGDFSE